jgi:hypothetical protein
MDTNQRQSIISKCGETYIDCTECTNKMEHFEHWYYCNSWGDLLCHMLKFLKGEYIDTPSHFGPLQEKDPLYKEKLIKLNALGVISENGQEFEQIHRLNKSYMQREYLVFAFKSRDDSHLQTILDKFQKADFYFQAFAHDTKLPTKYFISTGLQLIGCDENEYWVTRTLNHNTKEYDNHTHLVCYEDMPNILVEYCDILETVLDNLVIVQGWAKTWDFPKDGIYLLDKIIQCFE